MILCEIILCQQNNISYNPSIRRNGRGGRELWGYRGKW